MNTKSILLVLLLACMPALGAEPLKLDLNSDPLPPGAIARFGTIRLREQSTFAIAFTRDGKSIVTCGCNWSANLWDVATGRLIRRFPCQQPQIFSIALSADGKRLVTAESGMMRLWDVETGKEIRNLKGADVRWGRPIRSLADGQSLAWGRNGKFIDFRDATTLESCGAPAGMPKNRNVTAVSTNGAVYAMLDNNNFEIRQMRPARKVGSIAGDGRETVVAISADGRRAATLPDRPEPEVRIWDVPAGKRLFAFQMSDARSPEFTFSPDGRRCLAARPIECCIAGMLSMGNSFGH